MTMLFAVIRRHGPAWRDGAPLEGQDGWRAHADFMNGLAAAGFVALGGPLEGTDRVLLVVRADSEETVRARLADDPWTRADILPVASIAPWALRQGALDAGERR